MRRSSLRGLACLAAAAAATLAGACRSEPGPPAVPSTSGPGPTPATTAPPPEPGEATLTLVDLVLEPGQRLVVVAGGGGPDLRVTVEGASAPLRACPAGGVAGRRPGEGGTCRALAGGATATVEHGPDLPALEIAVGPTARQSRVDVGRLVVTYRAGRRDTTLRMPALPPGARTELELAPTGTGPFRAEATWEAAADARARLTAAAGGAVVSTAEGPPPLRAEARVSPAAAARLTWSNAGTATVPPATLAVTWP